MSRFVDISWENRPPKRFAVFADRAENNEQRNEICEDMKKATSFLGKNDIEKMKKDHPGLDVDQYLEKSYFFMDLWRDFYNENPNHPTPDYGIILENFDKKYKVGNPEIFDKKLFLEEMKK